VYKIEHGTSDVVSIGPKEQASLWDLTAKGITSAFISWTIVRLFILATPAHAFEDDPFEELIIFQSYPGYISEPMVPVLTNYFFQRSRLDDLLDEIIAQMDGIQGVSSSLEFTDVVERIPFDQRDILELIKRRKLTRGMDEWTLSADSSMLGLESFFLSDTDSRRMTRAFALSESGEKSPSVLLKAALSTYREMLADRSLLIDELLTPILSLSDLQNEIDRVSAKRDLLAQEIRNTSLKDNVDEFEALRVNPSPQFYLEKDHEAHEESLRILCGDGFPDDKIKRASDVLRAHKSMEVHAKHENKTSAPDHILPSDRARYQRAKKSAEGILRVIRGHSSHQVTF